MYRKRSYKKRTNKNRSYKKKSRMNKRKSYKKSYKKKGGSGGSYLPFLSGVSPERYIPYGGNIVGNLDTPQSTNDIVNGVSIDTMTFMGGRKKTRRTKKNIKQKKIKGGSIFPQQLINSGRGVSDFFWDKVNGYQGYQPAPSSSPYTQPIDSTNDISLISLY
jgi:hypothetical protein